MNIWQSMLSINKWGNILLNRIFTLTVGLVISFYVSAENWDENSKQSMISGCTYSLINSTKKDFEQRVVKAGNPDAVFPRELIEPPMAILCSCVVNRAARENSYEDAVNNQQIFMPYIQDAFSGGECKPTGTLGEMMGFE